MKKSLLVIFIMLISHLSWGQEAQANKDLIGNWELHIVANASEDCPAPIPFPIKELHFQGDKFTLVGLEEKVIGNYEYTDHVLRMYNAVKNGKPQAKEEQLSIKSISNEEMVFEHPVDCGVHSITFKKIS